MRNAAWRQLDQNVIAKVVRRIFALLNQRLTKHALGTALPFIGIAIGASLNAWTMSRTADGADLLYRQQFLCDKYELPFPGGEPTMERTPQDEQDIPIADIIEEEIEEDERADLPPDDEEGSEQPPGTSDA